MRSSDFSHSIDLQARKQYALRAVPLQNIHIDDAFWNRYTELIHNVSIPYQWEILNDRVADAPPSRCIHNFRIAAGEIEGRREGVVFQDSDLAKWLEAVAYSLSIRPNPELERTADEAIELIGRAQCADGYLNTHYTLTPGERRWSNLAEGHELYCAGHMIEAAVAYYQATGKDTLLKIVCRFADLIAQVFGPEPGQLQAYPGHPEIELALVRLYEVSGNERYLRLAKYFVDARGQGPNYFLQEMARPDFVLINPEFAGYDPAYSQSHLPVREQKTAEGHAVRAVYLYCAMADIAHLCGDDDLLEQCKTLWSNMVQKRMYITGSIGSSGLLERFTTDYDLPGDAGYSETCASIGLALFGLRMARITRDAHYIDTVERALYNTVRAGISMQGDTYFYVNPMEVWPAACMDRTSREHVKAERQKWYNVACCPTNIARTFTALGQYLYSCGPSELFVNLFVRNDMQLDVSGSTVSMHLETNYPRSGKVSMRIGAPRSRFTLHCRVPAFAENYTVRVNGERVQAQAVGGYFPIEREWGEDLVEIAFDMPPQFVCANPLVRANSGKVAIVRGPEVYCLEEVDNGDNLSAVVVDPNTQLREEWNDDLLGGTVTIHCKGAKIAMPGEGATWGACEQLQKREIDLTAVPYGSWGNRAGGEMIVWLHAAL